MESESSPDFSFLTGKLLSSGGANEESVNCGESGDGQSLTTRGGTAVLLHSQGSGGMSIIGYSVRGVLYVEVILYSKECNWYTRCCPLNGSLLVYAIESAH